MACRGKQVTLAYGDRHAIRQLRRQLDCRTQTLDDRRPNEDGVE
jgi:hypothetical protein